MSLKNKGFAALYFAVQRLRNGVSRQMIDEARWVLESSNARWRSRALERLRATHGRDLTWESLESHAPVDRRTLVDRAREIIHQSAGRERFDVRRTSGSTGTPFVFPKDRSMEAWMDAAMWAVYSWHGVQPGAPHARFWGMPLDRRKRIAKTARDRLIHRRRIGAFDLSDSNVTRQFASLLTLKADYAYGYPTLMATFADLCRRRGLEGSDLGLKVVISTGEILSPAIRHDLVSFFGCPVVNEYGCTESGIVAFECEEGSIHSVPVAIWPEIVDTEGAPTKPGELGEVVVSDLYGTTMPLLRYRLHDQAALKSGGCRCGRDIPTLDITSGRVDSFIETPQGRVYDAILAYTVQPQVQRFKVYQTGPARLEAHIVPGAGFDQMNTPAACKRSWEEALGPGMTVTVRTVADIPLESSGKLRYFVPLAS